MRQFFVGLVLFTLATLVHGQFTMHTIWHQGLVRGYRQYIPSTLPRSAKVPLVIALHGIGDTILQFSGGGLEYYSDTAHFLLVVPQALRDPRSGAATWNSGATFQGMVLNGGVDDVGFIKALIDTLSLQRNIDQDRIYICGFSMGGFMAYRLACELSDRVAAIASVAGDLGNGFSCRPSRAIPILDLHGTADSAVGYAANFYGLSTTATLALWSANNGCGRWPDTLHLPDLSNDGYTVDRIVWRNCNHEFGIEHFKVMNAGHVWLSHYNDIDYTKEIWRFFHQYSRTSGFVGIANQPPIVDFAFSPNPVLDRLAINFSLAQSEQIRWRLCDLNGQVLLQGLEYGWVGPNVIALDLEDLPAGLYALQIQGRRWIKQGRVMVE